MTKTQITFSKRLGEDHYEVARVTFDGVRERQGFRRSVTTTRHIYRVNGQRITKAVFLAMKEAAQ
jgi:hypothetical protein